MKQHDICNGKFDFSGINTSERRIDAYKTIAQFAELDRAVDIAHSDIEKLELSITSFENECDKFANSFLRSEIVSLQGLRYVEMP